MGRDHSWFDVIVYLPKEKVLFAGDLLAFSTPSENFNKKIRGGSYRVINVRYRIALRKKKP